MHELNHRNVFLPHGMNSTRAMTTDAQLIKGPPLLLRAFTLTQS
jgi:hypothetical protein